MEDDVINQTISNQTITNNSTPKSENTTKEKLEFTEKEINKMPKKFRSEFRVEGCTARIYKKKFSNKGYGYEIFYRRNGSLFISLTHYEKNLIQFFQTTFYMTWEQLSIQDVPNAMYRKEHKNYS